MDKIIGITNAPDDVISAYLDEQSILVRAHGKYVGGHIVIYEDSQQIASGDLIDGREVEGTGTYDYNLTPVDGYSGYDDTKSYRLVIDGDEIDSVINSNITNLPIDALYIIAGLNGEMNVTSTIPDLANVSVSQTKTVTTKNYQTKKLDKSLLPDSVESGIKAANTKATNAMYAAQGAQDTANKAVSDAATAQSAANIAQTTANTAKSTADAAAPKENPVFAGTFSQNRKAGTTVGQYSHAEGLNTTASGKYAHAEGYASEASGFSSHAEGYVSEASGEFSHAEGGYTEASAKSSHAEGENTTASGFSSHAEGRYTIAASPSQHVQGKFNAEDTAEKYVHIVGNGTSTADRSNAHTIDWNGVPWYQGRPQFGGTAQDNGAQTVVGNGDKEIILASSTSGSTKKFKI